MKRTGRSQLPFTRRVNVRLIVSVLLLLIMTAVALYLVVFTPLWWTQTIGGVMLVVIGWVAGIITAAFSG